MRENGIETAAAVAEHCNISKAAAGNMLNLKSSLYTKTGTVREYVQKVADTFRVLPEMLIPEELHYWAMGSNKAESELSTQEVAELMNTPAGLGYEGDEDLMTVLTDTLSERQVDIVARLFGLEGYEPNTLEEVGATYGVSGARVRQIKEKALFKLRYKDAAPLRHLLE